LLHQPLSGSSCHLSRNFITKYSQQLYQHLFPATPPPPPHPQYLEYLWNRQNVLAGISTICPLFITPTYLLALKQQAFQEVVDIYGGDPSHWDGIELSEIVNKALKTSF
jgi:hypothetical protein